MEEVEAWINPGYRFIAALPTGKVIVEKLHQ
jgi:hypothetical protein